MPNIHIYEYIDYLHHLLYTIVKLLSKAGRKFITSIFNLSMYFSQLIFKLLQ